MQGMLYALIPTALMSMGLAAALGVLVYWRRRVEGMRRSPLTEKLLRGAGNSLRIDIEELDFDVLKWLLVCAFVPALVFTAQLWQSFEQSILQRPVLFIIEAVASIFIVGFAIYKLLKLFDRRIELRTALQAELAVGQELDQLMRKGAVVYHDLPAERFNIDHTVIAPSGIYAIETKSRMKPKKGRGRADATVIFDGESLKFPDWVERDPIEQAQRQAKWLGKWLTSAVGERVSVKPVLVFPGWYVERRGRSDVTILSGKEVEKLLDCSRNDPLSAVMIERIAHQLAQRCRDVEPVLYGRSTRR